MNRRPAWAEDFATCEPCGVTSEDVRVCDHAVTMCDDCDSEGACVLCMREAAEERDAEIREGFEREDRWSA